VGDGESGRGCVGRSNRWAARRFNEDDRRPPRLLPGVNHLGSPKEWESQDVVARSGHHMDTTSNGTMARVGGTVNGYSVLVVGDVVVIERDGEEVARSRVEGLGRFVSTARDLKLGWGQFPDEAEVVFLYDGADACFGYALNLDWPDGSEWGYAPFGG
jgi:hypothetical protein